MRELPESWFVTLADASQDALFVFEPVDVDGRPDVECRYANRAAAALFGLPVEQLIGGRFGDMVRPVHAAFRRDIADALRSGRGIRRALPTIEGGLRASFVEYQIVPVEGQLAVSVADRSEEWAARRRADDLRSLLVAGSAASFSPCAVIKPVVDADGRIEDAVFELANEHMAALFRRPISDVIGARIYDLYEGTSRFLVPLMQQCVDTGTTATGEIDFAGQPTPIPRMRVRMTPASGSIVVHVDDQSDTVGDAEELIRSEALFRSLIQTASEGIVVTDLDGTIGFANEAFARMMRCGSSPVGSSYLDFLDASEATRVRADASAMIRGEIADVSRRGLHRRADGTEMWGSASSDVLRGPEGSAHQFVVMISDVDAQVRAEASLRESEERLRVILDHSDDIIVFADAHGQVRYANRAAARLVGVEPETILGRSLDDFVGNRERELVQPFLDSLRSGLDAPNTGLATITAVDKKSRVLRASMTAVRSAAGAVLGFVGVGSDVTDLIEHEETRRELLASLAVAEQRERERLAHDLHDGPVQRLAALSLRLGSALSVGGDLDAITRESERVVHQTIDELRTLMFQLSPPDLEGEMVGAAIRAQAQHLFDGTGTTIVLEDRLAMPLSPPTAVLVFRFAQECVINARKHSHAHAVTIRLFEDGPNLVIEVSDDGVGVGPMDTGGPMDAFAFGPHMGVRGMRDRAERFGGSCSVDRAPGGGTVARIVLPIDRLPAEPDGS